MVARTDAPEIDADGAAEPNDCGSVNPVPISSARAGSRRFSRASAATLVPNRAAIDVSESPGRTTYRRGETGADAGRELRSAATVSGPAIPSTPRPARDWNWRTATSVIAPK